MKHFLYKAGQLGGCTVEGMASCGFLCELMSCRDWGNLFSRHDDGSLLFLLTALLLDLLLVRVVKTLVRRRRPAQNRSDILSTFFVERYSFPSGHATRAAMCARFLLAQLVDTASMRVLVLGWAVLVSLSRLLLARHYVTDVGFGLAMGYCQYSLVERLWVTWDCLQDLLLMRLRERLNRAYSGLWMVDWKH